MSYFKCSCVKLSDNGAMPETTFDVFCQSTFRAFNCGW